MGDLRRPLGPVCDKAAPRTVLKGRNDAFERGHPALSRRTAKRIEPEVPRHLGGQFAVPAAADYGEIALVTKIVKYGRVGKMPKGCDFRRRDFLRG